MKRCELCTNVARMYCQSDNASLCYDCDQNVHSANFLVAKHSRTLLCHKCQSPTPWNASGLNLGRTASVCVNCLDEDSSQRRVLMEGGTSHRGNDGLEDNCVVHDDLREEGYGETDDDDTEHSDESEGEDVDEDEDEDAENQVVPWSIVASAPITASSSSEEFSSSRLSSDDTRSGTKRERLDAYIDSEDDTVCSSERSNSKARTEIDDAISFRSFRPI
ncbi:zinc finger protein CONSTANS-LIKE 4-like [Cynara cardunculus var. scolymus]|uniref:zinc finger protein CONSTANS-LIKE 4-like n=1 Tax=Cynara cardunculus var. scolymus TaxID=59895 RepID=UPI000D625A32|nr:zinc finger protein CONSTANS-LIKE 4-like [Cynara cardunculus var. scolymus]